MPLFETPLGPVDPDREYSRVVLGRSDHDPEVARDQGLPAGRDSFVERVVRSARLRAFEQDGETRYEVSGVVVVPTRRAPDGPLLEDLHEATVGFFLEDLISIEE